MEISGACHYSKGKFVLFKIDFKKYFAGLAHIMMKTDLSTDSYNSIDNNLLMKKNKTIFICCFR